MGNVINLDELVRTLHAEGFKVQYKKVPDDYDDPHQVTMVFMCKHGDNLLTFTGRHDEATNVIFSTHNLRISNATACTSVEHAVELMKRSANEMVTCCNHLDDID